jgi:hypothetical protein
MNNQPMNRIKLADRFGHTDHSGIGIAEMARQQNRSGTGSCRCHLHGQGGRAHYNRLSGRLHLLRHPAGRHVMRPVFGIGDPVIAGRRLHRRSIYGARDGSNPRDVQIAGLWAPMPHREVRGSPGKICRLVGLNQFKSRWFR